MSHRHHSLVLLPGLDGTGTLFQPLVDAVGSEAVTTVVDYASPEIARYADCRAAACRKLPGEEPYVLVGESFSGPVAVSIAAEHPPGLCGLVLVGSPLTHFSQNRPYYRGLLQPRRTTFGALDQVIESAPGSVSALPGT